MCLEAGSYSGANIDKLVQGSNSKSLDTVRQEISVYWIKLFELAVLAMADVR